MTTLNSATYEGVGILSIADRHMRAAQAKWSRHIQDDIFGIWQKDDLIATVEER